MAGMSRALGWDVPGSEKLFMQEKSGLPLSNDGLHSFGSGMGMNACMYTEGGREQVRFVILAFHC